MVLMYLRFYFLVIMFELLFGVERFCCSVFVNDVLICFILISFVGE